MTIIRIPDAFGTLSGTKTPLPSIYTYLTYLINIFTFQNPAPSGHVRDAYAYTGRTPLRNKDFQIIPGKPGGWRAR